jgi:hypothetical protein
LTEIDRLLQNPDLSVNESELLKNLRSAVKTYASAAEERAEAALNAKIKSILHSAYGIREISRRQKRAQNIVDLMEKQIRQAEAEMNKPSTSQEDKKEYQKIIDRNIKTLNEQEELASNCEVALKSQFSYYRELMDDATLKEDRKALEEQIARVGGDIQGQDLYHNDMRKCFGIISNHFKLALNRKSKDIKRSDIEVTGKEE